MLTVAISDDVALAIIAAVVTLFSPIFAALGGYLAHLLIQVKKQNEDIKQEQRHAADALQRNTDTTNSTHDSITDIKKDIKEVVAVQKSDPNL